MLIETELELGSGAEIEVDLPHEGAVVARVVWSSGSLFGCQFNRAIGTAALSAVELKARSPLPSMPAAPVDPALLGAGLGKKLEQTRKARGLTLAQVAEQLGVSKPTVWAWEKGKARPVDDRIPAIAEVLGLNPEELISAHHPVGVSQLLHASRDQIARALGLDARMVRILIEI
ncbi:MAG: hypothetical protein APF78_10830 [Sphingomonadales bacterium BRH_c3]|nr:MAG: hypothetical protein APF78_10830 [Sphingomonadales bacterium BRH_c3]